jgi:enoyl-CoA hydratase/carnithine racemase
VRPAVSNSEESDVTPEDIVENIGFERRDGVGWITIERPEAKNALTKAMYARIRDLVSKVWVDDSLYALALRGSDGAFAVGGDLKEMLTALEGDDRSAFLEYEEFMPFAALSTLPKPTIAVIDGLCMGGGLSLALVCDMAIASSRSTFAIPEAKVGIADAHTPRLMRDWVPPATLRYWLYTGATFSPAEASAAGLLTKVVEAAELEDSTDRILADLRASSPTAIRMYKSVLNESRTVASMHDAYVTMLGDEAHERLSAFSRRGRERKA